MVTKLDLYDKKILYELDIDARASASMIAKKIHLSKETVNFRIKRLIRNNYIIVFYSIINASRLGYRYYKIFIKFRDLNPQKEKEIIDYLKKKELCINLRVREGYYDFAFMTMQKYPLELKSFLHEFTHNFGEFILDKNINIVVTTNKFNQKILFPGESVRKSFSHGVPTDYVMNKIDLRIVKEISNNSRIKIIELARKIKADPKVIKYHMKKLESNKVLVGYAIDLNVSKLNYEFIQVEITVKDTDYIPNIIEFFDKTNTCIFAYELVGKYDISVELYIENDIQFREIIHNFREKFIQHCISYDISHVYHDFVLNWSPFSSYHPILKE
jgi:DNA-binding Lrp family transcriptional regulator